MGRQMTVAVRRCSNAWQVCLACGCSDVHCVGLCGALTAPLSTHTH
jgi:hypothetical protein